MLLICGNSADPLITKLLSEARKTDLPAFVLPENSLFEVCPFVLHRHGKTVSGFMELDGKRLDFQDLKGVVLRLPRTWWPSTDFSLSDQFFVYHETLASWFAVLDSLECPVVNRLGLGWWLQDPTYYLSVRASLARALHLPVHEPDQHALSTTGSPSSSTGPVIGQLGGVFRAGGFTFEDIQDEGLVAHLSMYADSLSLWEQSTGIALSHMRFIKQNGFQLISVDVSPPLVDVPAELVRRLARAILKGIVAGCGVAA